VVISLKTTFATMLVLFLSLSLWAELATAQIPDEFTNLKVLDEKITKADLMGKMRGMALGLGVRCAYCHAGEEGAPLSEIDFASDDKQTKETAREMLRMTAAINKSHIAPLASAHENKVTVKCVTCHRGQARPILIEDILDDARAASGVDSAKSAYVSLREIWYGTHTYDFGEWHLINYGGNLVQSGQTEDGLAFIRLAIELFPKSASGWLQLGFVLSQQGETLEARKYIEKGLEIEPDSRWGQRLLKMVSDSQEN